MIEISDERIIELMHEVVEGKEDFVYRPTSGDGCMYLRYGEHGVPTGEGSCLVGQVLIKAGVPVEALALHEGNGAHAILEGGEGNHQVAVVSETARHALAAAQEKQDSRWTWGDALAVFDKAMEVALQVRAMEVAVHPASPALQPA